MTASSHSPHWYRVANLKPALGTHAKFFRHVYRGKVWYVLRDEAGGRVHRFSPIAHDFVARMNGERTVAELWAFTENASGDEALTQDEVLELLGRLHGADLLVADIAPDSRELLQRYRARERKKWATKLWSPLSIRIPLIDPDRFLERTLGWVMPLFTRAGALLWLFVVAGAVFLAASHWSELTENLSDRMLTPGNLALLWVTYPLIKLLHELGHGYAAKRWGGEVHEMGVMFLVLVPLPYVDASSASAFPDKRKRALVGAAGVVVEIWLAAAAFFVWLNVEPGLMRTLAFDVMFIGGVSTLIFNGNPLLRFDGYYVLADLIDIPNLAARSQQYLGYLMQRYGFRRDDARSPVTTSGEEVWFFLYALAAFTYRMFIMFVIVLFIAGKFFFVGVLLALWAITTQLVVPLIRQLTFLVSSPALQQQRGRALAVTAASLLVVTAILTLAPAPSWTRTEGVVWAPEQSEVRMGTDAIVVRFLTQPGSSVAPGDPLLLTDDPILATRVAVLEAELREFNARYTLLRASSQVEAAIAKDDIETLEASLAAAREQLDRLTIRSSSSGVFIVERPQDLEGRYLEQGTLVGYVADPAKTTIRVAVRQSDIGLVRSQTKDVAVRLSDQIDRTLAATIVREVPAASGRLPSAALSTRGGGSFAVNPTDSSGTTTLEDVFHFELQIDEPISRLGGRAFVRFDHGSEPLAQQFYRSMRQLFLSRFHV
jgi:putative peptide zinc metalloprotease protein